MVTTLHKPKPKRQKAPKVKPLPTIWEVSDDLWQRILPILKEFWPAKATGRHHANWRKARNGIIFRLRSGCQWDQLPRRFGPKSTVHAWFQRWCAGGPLGVVLAAANVNDHLLLRETIEAIVIERPAPTVEEPQHLCLDADYDNPTGREAATAGQYTPHIVPVRKEQRSKTRRKGHKPRRWVVERTIAWLCKCRGILVRYDKKDANYLGLIQLACALLWYRRLHRLGRCDTKRGRQNTS